MEKLRLLNNRQLNLWHLYNALLLIVPFAVGFNLDTEHPRIFKAPNDISAFGYQVCHFGSGSVLVTDPLYNNGTGSVYRCVYQDDQCVQLPIEVQSNGAFGLSLACTEHRAMVCSARVQQECEGFHYLHGVCVELNVSLTHSHTHKPVFQECHEIPPLDAVILFDDSLSISSEDFRKMINFIKDVIRSFTNPRSQVAVAKFSSRVSAVFQFENFAADRNADNLMSGITHSKGNTHTPSAIRFVLEEMFQEKVGMRNNSQKLLVVVTDGKSNDKNDNFSSVIALANKRGVTRFAIGVGNEYSREELEQIATEPRYVFETPSFSSLSSIVSQLTERIFSIEGTNVGNSSSIQLELSQGGFSVALSEEVSVFGAVGTFSWSGGLEEKIPELNASFINASTVKDMDNSYLGYSVAMATVLGSRVYFAGAPRHKHTGAVFGFTQDAHKQWSVTHTAHGTQLGSYFGAELCVLYGDDIVLLAVGAPMFYTAGFGGEVQICSVETGALNCSGALRGSVGHTDGRFGSALAGLQDLNEDSVMELAVGAPNEEQGKGAIYIFTSYRGGFRPKHTQRVGGAAVGYALQYFGLSLHSVGDLSSDGLPDLVVGSKGAATVLRTQPVICVPVSITLDPPVIAQNFFHCSAPYSLNTPIAKATLCLKLREVSRGTIQGPLHATVSVFLELDSGSTSPRLFFYPMSSISHWNTTLSNKSVCHTFPITIQRCISDYQDVPLSGRLTVRGQTVGLTQGLRPVVHPDCPNTHTITHTVLLEKVCGEDHVCVSDLSVSLQVSRNMVVNIEGFRVNVSVVVVNEGEDASGTELCFVHPSVLSFTRISLVESVGYIECSSYETGVMNLTHTMCRHGFTIFRQRAKMVFIMSFQLSDPAALGDQVDVNVTVKSKNENPGTLHDNSARVSMPVKQLVHFLLRDGGSTQYVRYNNSALLQHTYELTNKGVLCTPVSVVFVLPLETTSGLLWDVSPPEINVTEAKCEKPKLLKKDNTSYYSQNCRGSRCHLIGCSVGLLTTDQPVTFSFTGKINTQTKVDNVRVESWGLVSFDQNRYTQYLNEEDLLRSIVTVVESPSQLQTTLIASLSVLFGVLVMMFIFMVLYKVGFFKSISFENTAQEAGGPTTISTEENDSNTQAENTDGQTAASKTHTENPNKSNNCNAAHIVEETSVL
ncbi:integrin alpha-X isoform X1 [Pangasianodon hypophthalmus]|uniref:integrin alpha-X isoform X1 n=1 Tax=Pangasianodon hypophthalmus TaxID=310915 RepID=UPI0023070FD1|nr:integrin alpha-X isoform X1 [Pangasianodon hypophthalmus]